MLGVALGQTPTAVPGASGLFALNIDPEAAARDYRERMVAPYRGILPAAAIASMEEQFSGACTVEIAAFDEFSKLLGEPAATAQFDHVIFDTAPTGHTLRLLTLPSAWSEFIDSSTGGASCLGPLAGLEKQKALYAATVARLADPSETSVVLVSRPDASALREAERTREELAALGVSNLQLALNGVLAVAATDDPDRAGDDGARCRGPGRDAGRVWRGCRSAAHRCWPWGPSVSDALRLMADPEQAEPPAPALETETALPAGLSTLVDELAQAGRGVILTMGKGGVGKTTVAAAIAVALARRGHAVQLSTTDPAAHVAAAIGASVPGLQRRPHRPGGRGRRATRPRCWPRPAPTWTPTAGPCWRRTCARPAPKRSRSSAPSPARWTPARTASSCSTPPPPGTPSCCWMPPRPTIGRCRAPRARCPRRCGNCSRGCATRRSPACSSSPWRRPRRCTRPNACKRTWRGAGIAPFAWVINQSLLASGTRHPLLRERGAAEVPFIRRVADQLSRRCALVPWLPEAPVGVAGLAQLTQ